LPHMATRPQAELDRYPRHDPHLLGVTTSTSHGKGEILTDGQVDSRNLCKTTERVRVAATIMIFGLGIAGLSSAVGGPTQAVRGSDRAVGAEHANRDLRPRIPGPYADAGLPDPDWTKNGQFSIA